MENSNNLSQNIKNLRVKFRYTQSFIAKYLNQSTAAVNQYENDSRAIPEKVVEKLALLYNVNEIGLYEDHSEKKELLTNFAFRVDEVSAEDMQTISKFKKIITNYINMSSALANEYLTN